MAALTTARAAAVTPMNIIESAPAAGVVGVQALIRQIGVANAISFDMGGTTAKASLIENGELSRALEYSVGGGVMIGSRLLSGAGYTLKVPAIDLAEVGAGAGRLSGSTPAARCRSGRTVPVPLRVRSVGVEHEKTYGHRAGVEEPAEVVTLKVVGRGFPDVPRAGWRPRPICRQMFSSRSP
jgi:Hydantoinase/oxoprolinase